MDLLSGTPYLLDPSSADRVLRFAADLDQRVSLLRSGGTLAASVLEKLRQAWGVQLVYESAGIEGNELTLSETQMAIQRGITISGKPPEHSREVQNLHAAHAYLEDLAHQSTSVTEWEIREVQSLIVGKEQPESGCYRSIEVAISNSPHTPPHPIRVPDQMRDFAAWLKLPSTSALPTPLLAAASHAWLVYIHPFRDGNGRTARAITNLLLIRSGYPVVVIRRKDRQRYYEALRASDQADITPLLELMVERSDDSLKQIDRVRTEVSGVSVAAQLMRQQEEARFRVWLDGLRLLASTLEEMFKQAESADPAFRVAVQHYDHPTVEDFRELCAGNSAGNTWLLQFRLSRGGVGHRILCWIGYSSTDLNRALSVPGHIPSIKLSVPNPSAPPPWVEPDHFFPSSAREFAYFKGQYYRVEAPPAGVRTIRFDSALALASQFVQELLVGWYVTPNV